MAPFAFLGTAYDDRLKAVYTQMSFHTVLSGNPIFGLFGEGLYSTRPMQHMVASQVDPKMLADVATAYRNGRRLFVVTTNLDAQRPVLWNMGAIAASGRPQALELFRQVLVASASVPGAFDPVFIDAEANGHHSKEMHVDGGTAYPLFAIPVRLVAATRQVSEHRGSQLYIIINNNLEPAFTVTKPKTLTIVARAFNTLVKSDCHTSPSKAQARIRAQSSGCKTHVHPKSCISTKNLHVGTSSDYWHQSDSHKIVRDSSMCGWLFCLAACSSSPELVLS